MKSLEKFHKRLMKESTNEYSIEEAVSKDLAKEDALQLVAEFVKDVKKKFDNKEDKLEILRDVSKTLEFYINEIENTTSNSIEVMSVSQPPSSALSFDDVMGDSEEDDTQLSPGSFASRRMSLGDREED